MRPFVQLATVLSGSQHLLESGGSSQSPPPAVDASERRRPQRSECGSWESDRTALTHKCQLRAAGNTATGAHDRSHARPQTPLARCQDRWAVVRAGSSHERISRRRIRGEVDLRRGTGVTTRPFPQVPSRTRRAPFSAPGAPRVLPAGHPLVAAAGPGVHGVGILLPR
jgi:hypothetical protein